MGLHPMVKNLARSIRGRLDYYRLLVKWRINALTAETPPTIDPFQTLWVDPDCIELQVLPERFTREDVGRVVDGCWDQNVTRITEHGSLYDGLKSRYIDDIPWEETEFFRLQKDRIKQGGTSWGVNSIPELRKRYRNLDVVYNSMKAEGYISNSIRIDIKHVDALEEILIHIGRDGRILFAGQGNHRIRLAKLLNLDTIAVRVCVRHSEWQNKRNEIVSSGSAPSSLDINPTHPDIEYLDYA